jgi:putative transposase
VRNGYHQPRKVTTAAGVVEVKAPRVNGKRVDEATGASASGSARRSCRRGAASPQRSARVLPLLYLHGLSCGDLVPALEQLLGSSAGLCPATLTRLTQQWQGDHAAFMDRDLAEVDYVYPWADGIHLNLRLQEATACALVWIGVRAEGPKELIALKDGYRESGQCWGDLLRECARRGLRAPVLAVGEGGPWACGRP